MSGTRKKTTVVVELVVDGNREEAVNTIWNLLAWTFNQPDSELRWYRIKTDRAKRDIYQEDG